MCVCVCVRERERERKREKVGVQTREKVGVQTREIERESIIASIGFSPPEGDSKKLDIASKTFFAPFSFEVNHINFAVRVLNGNKS